MSSSRELMPTKGHPFLVLHPRDESKPIPAQVAIPKIPKLSEEEKRRIRDELIDRPITPPSGPPPFAGTLRHDRADLSEEAIHDIENHRVSRDLAKTVCPHLPRPFLLSLPCLYYLLLSSISSYFILFHIPCHNR